VRKRAENVDEALQHPWACTRVCVCVSVPCRLFSDSYSQLFWLTPSCTAVLLWGLGRLHWRPPVEWADRLFLETYTQLQDFKPAEITGQETLCVLWGGFLGGRGRRGRGVHVVMLCQPAPFSLMVCCGKYSACIGSGGDITTD